MRKSVVFPILLFLACASFAAAQTTESGTARQLTLSAGGFGSFFDPHDDGNSVYSNGSSHLAGVGTYFDLHFTHWFQLEGEARWLRLYEYAGEHQDTYLLGPKVPIHQFGRAGLYGKAMIGIGKMTFPNRFGYGTFTALAYGGGLDYRLSRKLTVRAVDFEFQQWPVWLDNSALYPFGVSAGLAYKVF